MSQGVTPHPRGSKGWGWCWKGDTGSGMLPVLCCTAGGCSVSLPFLLLRDFHRENCFSWNAMGNSCGEMFYFWSDLVLPYQLIRGTISYLHLYQGRLKEYNFNLIALFQLLSVAVNDSETTACSSRGIWLKLHSYIIYHLFSLARDSENTSVIMSFNQIKLYSLDLEQETVLNSCKMKNTAKKLGFKFDFGWLKWIFYTFSINM